MKIPELFALISPSMSVVTTLCALYAANNPQKSAADNSLRQQMTLYLEQYEKLSDDELIMINDPVSYHDQKGIASKAKMRIIAGLLVGVVDVMITNKDPRSAAWKEYIAHIRGPLSDRDFKLLDYASTCETRRFISDWQQKLESNK